MMQTPSRAPQRMCLAAVVALLLVTACGSNQGGAKDPDKAQDGENTNEGFSSGGKQDGMDDVEPADHDIEVPPAP